MDGESKKTWRRKTHEFFASHFSDRNMKADPSDIIVAAISSEYPDLLKAYDIAFHLTDWDDEAAFLVALRLAPSLFTSEELADGIRACLIHIPNHVAAAATLGGWPMQDVFHVGAVIAPSTPKP